MSEPTPYPMLLDPRYIAKPWGGRSLATHFGRALPGEEPIGESWELFDRPGGSSTIRNGVLAGTSLADLRGARELPLLLKLLDMRGSISVQIHPDEERARLDGTDPKTEAWVVLQADPGARIYRGLRQGVTEKRLREAAGTAAVVDCLHSFEPAAGDVVLIQAGVPHAVTGGILAFEVQQSSEATYRLWDWDRNRDGGETRALQVEAALRAFRDVDPGPDRVVPREEEDDGFYRRALLVQTRWFAVEHLTCAGVSTFVTERDGEDRWHALFVLQGSGTVRAFDRRAEPSTFHPGDTLLLPAGQEHVEIEPVGGTVVQALAVRSC